MTQSDPTPTPPDAGLLSKFKAAYKLLPKKTLVAMASAAVAILLSVGVIPTGLVTQARYDRDVAAAKAVPVVPVTATAGWWTLGARGPLCWYLRPNDRSLPVIKQVADLATDGDARGAAYLTDVKKRVDNAKLQGCQSFVFWNNGDAGYDGSPSEWTKISGIPLSYYKSACAYVKSAGLRLGVCVAGQGITTRDAAGLRSYTEWTPGVNDGTYVPARDDLIVAGTLRHITFALTEYGVDEVYIDSNMHQGQRGAQIARMVMAAVPNVLCIWENHDDTSRPAMLAGGTVLISFDYYPSVPLIAPQFYVERIDRWLTQGVTHADWAALVNHDGKVGHGVPMVQHWDVAPEIATWNELVK